MLLINKRNKNYQNIICIIFSFVVTLSYLFSQTNWEQKYNTARKYYQDGKFKDAITESKSALDIGIKELGPKHPNLAATLNILAMAYNKIGNLKLAAEKYSEAIQIYSENFGNRHIYIGNLYDKVAEIYIKLKMYQTADSLLNIAYKIITDSVGSINEDVASVRFHQALLALNLSDYNNAERFIIETLEIIKKVYGENHNYYSEALSSYGLILFYQGKLSEAENVLQKSMKIKEQLFDKKIHPSMASTLSNLSQLYLAKGLIIEAERNAGLAMKIYESLYGYNSLETLNSMISLAIIYKYRGLVKQAEDMFNQCISHSETLLNSSDVKLLYFYYQIGVFFLQNNRKESIKTIIYKADKIINNQNENSPDLIYGYNLMGEFYLFLKDYNKSEIFFLKALEISKKQYITESIDIKANIALIKVIKSDFKGFDNLINEIIEDSKANGSLFNQQILNIYIKISDQLISLNQIDRAKELINKAQNMLKKAGFKEHPEYSKIYFNLARISFINNNYKESENLANLSLEIKEKYFGSYHPDIMKILELKINVFEKLNLNENISKLKEKIEKIRLELNK